jgi:Uma2 family endonuclease
MTTEEMLALPENGVDRELIRGPLSEKPMTVRNRRHSRIEICIGTELENRRKSRPEPRGQVVGGEAGFRLSRDPDTTVGMEVAYVTAEVAAIEPDAAYFEGPPVLAVEILSPSDTQEDIDEKVELYLEPARRSSGWSTPGSGPSPSTAPAPPRPCSAAPRNSPPAHSPRPSPGRDLAAGVPPVAEGLSELGT